MANQEKYQLYDKGTRMWFQVTEEQYKAYRREQNAFRVKMMDHGRCTCPQCKWWLCDTTCMDCEYRIEKALSLDAPMADGDVCLADTIPDDGIPMEEEAAGSDLLRDVSDRLRELDPDADRMLEIWKANVRISDRAMAEVLGCPQRTFADRMKRIRVELRKACEY